MRNDEDTALGEELEEFSIGQRVSVLVYREGMIEKIGTDEGRIYLEVWYDDGIVELAYPDGDDIIIIDKPILLIGRDTDEDG